MRLYFRQGNITFSKHFVDLLRDNDIVLTRRSRFNKSGILVNHGNSKPIKIGKKARKFYVLNRPEAIHYCSNKMDNYKLLKEYYPKTYNDYKLVKEFPVLAKPLHGHHGYGIHKFDTFTGLASFMATVHEPYIIQEYIPIRHEYRFNIVDGEVFQTSHKQKLDMVTDKGGYLFSYRSLGAEAKISSKFKSFISDVLDTINDKIGCDLGDYCIDVIKGMDNEYYVSECNSAYGLGQFTLDKLVEKINEKYHSGELEKYRVR